MRDSFITPVKDTDLIRMVGIGILLVVPLNADLILSLILTLIVLGIITFIAGKWLGLKMGYREEKARRLAWISLVAFLLVGFPGPIIIWLMAWFIKQ